MKKFLLSKLFALLLFSTFLLFSCSNLSEQNGSVAFAIPQDVMRAAGNLSDENQNLTLELSLYNGNTPIQEYVETRTGAQWNSVFEKSDDIYKISFDAIPAGTEVYALCSISSGDTELYSGTSQTEKVVRGGVTSLSLKLIKNPIPASGTISLETDDVYSIKMTKTTYTEATGASYPAYELALYEGENRVEADDTHRIQWTCQLFYGEHEIPADNSVWFLTEDTYVVVSNLPKSGTYQLYVTAMYENAKYASAFFDIDVE